MLGRRRIKLPRIERVGHKRAIAQRPDAGKFGYAHTFICDNATPLQRARQPREKQRRCSAGRPDQLARGDLCAFVQRHLLAIEARDLRPETDLNATRLEFFLRITTEPLPSSGRISSPGCTSTTRSMSSVKR